MPTEATYSAFDGKQILNVSLIDNDAFTLTHGAVSVLASPTEIVPASTTRISLIVQNLGASPVYLGSSSVTVANGLQLGAGATISDLVVRTALYGISASGTVDVRWVQEAV